MSAIHIRPTESVAALKKRICEHDEDISPSSLCIILGGRQIQEEKGPVSAYGIQNKSVVHIAFLRRIRKQPSTLRYVRLAGVVDSTPNVLDEGQA